MKVLIVDDNERIRKLIVKLLDKLNIPVEIIECENGEDAVSIFSNEAPDLILMDIVMDRLDGFKAAQRIVAKNKAAKIIIVSQLAEDEYRQEALNSGAKEFLNKENLSLLPDIIKKIIMKNEFN